MNTGDTLNYEMTLDGIISDHIHTMLHVAETVVRRVRPYAKLLPSCNRKGQATHVGIYDISLSLNERHTFDSNRQFAPQLIGMRLEYRDAYETLPKQKIQFEAWLSAYKHLKALQEIQ